MLGKSLLIIVLDAVAIVTAIIVHYYILKSKGDTFKYVLLNYASMVVLITYLGVLGLNIWWWFTLDKSPAILGLGILIVIHGAILIGPKAVQPVFIMLAIVLGIATIASYPSHVRIAQKPLVEKYINMGSPKPEQVGEMLDLMKEFQERLYMYNMPPIYRGEKLINFSTGGLEFLMTQGVVLRVFVGDYNQCSGKFTDIHFVVFHEQPDGTWVPKHDVKAPDLDFGAKGGTALIPVDNRTIETTFVYDGTPNDCDQSTLYLQIR